MELDDPIPKSSEKYAVKKVPGTVPAVGNLSHEKAQFRQSISGKTVPELKDLLQRQTKILENKTLCSKLPDKGEKVKERIALIQNVIEEKSRVLDLTTNLFSNLTIGGKEVSMEEIEWKYGSGLQRHVNDKPLDSDDDSDDETLKVLASREVPARNAQVPDEEFDLHSTAISTKVDHIAPRKKFVPVNSLHHETLPPGQTVPLKHRDNRPDKHVELMPLPPESKGKAQMLSLHESLVMQKEQAEKYKELQVKQAVEKLSIAPGEPGGDQSDVSDKMAYREVMDDEEDDEEEEGVNITFSQYEL